MKLNQMNNQNRVSSKLFHISILENTPLNKNAFRHINSPFPFQQHNALKQKDIPLDIIYRTMLNEYNNYPLIKFNSTKISTTLIDDPHMLITKSTSIAYQPIHSSLLLVISID